ncbi:hypothetical protein GOP47_0026804 [Adiantum capillus-veneris]|nr:hypothetical protein GOP47_0026804 [Adiantum capillus-veneris]
MALGYIEAEKESRTWSWEWTSYTHEGGFLTSSRGIVKGLDGCAVLGGHPSYGHPPTKGFGPWLKSARFGSSNMVASLKMFKEHSHAQEYNCIVPTAEVKAPRCQGTSMAYI